MGQFSVTILAVAGSVLSDNQQLILDWFTENSADGMVPEVSTVRKRYAPIWWRLQDRL